MSYILSLEGKFSNSSYDFLSRSYFDFLGCYNPQSWKKLKSEYRSISKSPMWQLPSKASSMTDSFALDVGI